MLLLTLGAAWGGACAPSPQPSGMGAVQSPLSRPDPDARYLIYLHPKIVEDAGIPAVSPEYGAYHYEEILDRLAGYGFIVVSEVRPHEASSTAWAARVSAQVDSLLGAGVPPHHVSVVGASKGAYIAALVSHAVETPGVRYVILAMCPAEIVSGFREQGIDLHGDVLAIRDAADRPDYAGTCRPLFDASPDIGRHEEIVLNVGTGHGILFQPLDEWVEPTVRWVLH